MSPRAPTKAAEGRSHRRASIANSGRSRGLSLPPLAIYALKRLLWVPVAILGVLTLSFGLVNLIPSDPARLIVGNLATSQQLHDMRVQLGLSKSLEARYFAYVEGVAQGNLGRSYYSQRPVLSDIAQYLPNTLELIVMSLLVAAALGVLMGSVGAYFSGRSPDRAVRAVISIFQSIPDFLLALILIYVFFYLLRLAPAPVGRLGFADPPPPHVTGALILDTLLTGNWSLAESALAHSVLPVLTLGLFYSAYLGKLARSTVGRALASPSAEFARACGLRESTILRYALRNSRTQLLTYSAMLFAALIGGAAIVETIFAWGGIGQWAVTGILKLDVPQIQGFMLIGGLFTLAAFLILDILTVLLDPRVTLE